MNLPEELSTEFRANDVAFSTFETSRLEAATRHILDRYGADFADHSEYDATLRVGASLAALAPRLEAALGEGWIRDDEVASMREVEIISFVRSDDARLVIVSVAGEGPAAPFHPTRIFSSVPIEGLE